MRERNKLGLMVAALCMLAIAAPTLLLAADNAVFKVVNVDTYRVGRRGNYKVQCRVKLERAPFHHPRARSTHLTLVCKRRDGGEAIRLGSIEISPNLITSTGFGKTIRKNLTFSANLIKKEHLTYFSSSLRKAVTARNAELIFAVSWSGPRPGGLSGRWSQKFSHVVKPWPHVSTNCLANNAYNKITSKYAKAMVFYKKLQKQIELRAVKRKAYQIRRRMIEVKKYCRSVHRSRRFSEFKKLKTLRRQIKTMSARASELYSLPGQYDLTVQ